MKMLSDITKRLMNGEENEEVDFKEDIPKDLAAHVVSFANASGGYILIGIKEYQDEQGRQRGELVGSNGIALTDANKQKIQNYCENCREDLFSEIAISVEESSDSHGVYRIYIPSGRHKPYCTANGTYIIRRNGRKYPIHPRSLLSLINKDVVKQAYDFTLEINNIRKAKELKHSIELCIEEVIALNKERASYIESKWNERSKDIYNRCLRALSHPLIKKENFVTQFKDNSGFGGAVNGTPVQRGEFRGTMIVGRHIMLIKGLEILDEAVYYLEDYIEMKSATIPNHLILIDQLEIAIKDLINLNKDENIDSKELINKHDEWRRQIRKAFLDNILFDKFFKDFQQATSGMSISSQALPRGNFRGNEMVARDEHILRTLNILDKALCYIQANPE